MNRTAESRRRNRSRARSRTARPLAAAGAAALAGVLAFTAAAPSGLAAPPTSSADRAAGDLRQHTVDAALAALRANASVLGFATDGLGALGLGEAHGVVVTDVVHEESGAAHVRMDRTFHGLPVLGGDFVVHRSAAGRWTGADATLFSPLDLSVDPVVTASAATATALGAVGAVTSAVIRPVLLGPPALVVHAYDRAPRLAWDVYTAGRQADGQTPSRLHTYVDAVTGKVLSQDEAIHTTTGLGHGIYSGLVPLDTAQTGGVFELRDPGRGGGYTADAEDRSDDCLPVALPLCMSTAPATVFTDEDNKWGSGSMRNRQSVGVDAQYGSDTTWDYFKNVHGRLGVSNHGIGVYSRVHYGYRYDNAFWNDDCSCMTFGDGDGKVLGPMVSLDIAAHEITHGLTSNTAKLRNVGESGGLNEATSDIFGAMIEFYANNAKDVGDYLIGETPFIKKRDKHGKINAIRFMDRPGRDGSSPDCWSPDAKQLDVHLLAGVGDHFFYLLSEGSGKKTINGTTYNSPTCNGKKVKGLGNATAAKIWYRALTLHMTSDSTYSDARDATLKAAKELFGARSRQLQAVEAAWRAVNVTGDTAVQGLFTQQPA